MSDPAAVVLSSTPIATFVAAVASLTIRRSPARRNLVLTAAGLGIILPVAAVLSARHWPLRVNWFEWLPGMHRSDAVIIALRADWLSVSAAMLIAVATLLIGLNSTDRDRFGPQLLLLLCAGQLLVFSANLVAVLLCWQVLLLLTAVVLLPLSRGAAGSLLITGLIADLPLYPAMALLWQNLGGLEFRQILSPAVLFAGEAPPPPVEPLVMAAFIAVAARLAVFPLCGWLVRLTEDDAGTSDTEIRTAVIPILMFAGVFLPARLLVLLTLSDPLRLLVCGGGVLAAVIAGACSLSGSRQARRVLALASLFALALAGLAIGSAAAVAGAQLMAGIGCLYGAFTLSGAASIGSLVLAVLIALGITGHESLLTAAWDAANAADPAVPLPLIIGFAIAHGLIAYSLVHSELAGLREAPGGRPVATAVLLTAVIAAMLAAATAGTADVRHPLADRLLSLDGPAPVGVGLTSLIGAIAAVVAWARRSAEITDLDAAGSLARIIRRRLYIVAATDYALRFPIRGTAQLTRFLDWIVVERAVFRGPAFVLKKAGEHVQELFDSRSPALAATALLAGAALMILMLLAG